MADKQSSEKTDGRAGARRVRTARPRKEFPPVQGDALPGEAEELVWQPGRTWPVTEQEALGVLRRGERLDMMRRSGAIEVAKLSDHVPGWDLSKEDHVSMRLTTRLRVLTNALAELEGSTFAEIVEDALLERVLGAPRDPGVVASRRRELLDATVGEAKGARAVKAENVPTQDVDLRAQVDRLQGLVDRLLKANPALPDGGS